MRATSAAGRLPVTATLGCAAVVALVGCAQLIDITIDGKSEPLRGPALGRRVAAQAIKIAGLEWKLPAIG
jgi:hypothetical protein